MKPTSRTEAKEEPPAVAPPAAAYVVALAVYVALGYFLKSALLNWVVGPLFLFGALYLLPRLVRHRPRRDGG